MPASVIYKIIDMWLNYELNDSKICSKLKEQYKLKELNIVFVFKKFYNFIEFQLQII